MSYKFKFKFLIIHVSKAFYGSVLFGQHVKLITFEPKLIKSHEIFKYYLGNVHKNEWKKRNIITTKLITDIEKLNYYYYCGGDYQREK